MQTNNSPLLEVGTTEVELIEFYLGDESYGVNVSKVLRVIALSETDITPTTDTPECVHGITHINDNPIPVLDLRKLLNIKADAKNNDRQLLLVLEFNSNNELYH